MSEAQFTLSAFGDEIAQDLAEQLRVLADLHVPGLDLRGAWGRNVSVMDDAMLAQVAALCAQYGVRVSCIASPLGKSPIDEPWEEEAVRVGRVFHAAHTLGTKRIRIFSYYPPAGTPPEQFGAYVPAATERLVRLASRAAAEGLELLLENEKGIVGETVQSNLALIEAVNSPALRFLWDPANFVQVGETQVTERGWSKLGRYVTYVHIKDARLSDHTVVAAGQGDGQVRELLTALRASGYHGVLALEPHLAIAGHSTGFSGPDGMAYAVKSLRAVMAETGCVEG